MNRQYFLFAFVPLGLIVFRLVPPPVATTGVLLFSAAFLPELTEYDPPLIPPLNKDSIGALVALVGCAWVAWKRIGRRRFGAGTDWVILTLVLCSLLTVVTNGEPAFTTGKRLPALGMRDALSMGVQDLLIIGIPFYLGRCMIRTPRDLRLLLTLLAGFGLVYGLAIVYESRMSPQLHRMLYGLHPNNFSKVYRLGGYRPMVFMESGLAVAIFMWTCAMATFGLARARIPVFGLPGSIVAALSAFFLLLCRSLGAILYGFVMLPLLALVPRRVAPIAVTVLALASAAYPFSRILDVVPTNAIHAAAAKINPERADSLMFRFENEDQLVDRTWQKPLFGWGGYLRARVRVDTGTEIRALDGFWVIILGERGMVGLGLVLTLLIWPQIRVARRLRSVRDPRIHAMLVTLALIVGIRAFDMMPNGLYSVIPFYLAGALFGVTEWEPAPARRRRTRPRGEAPDAAPGGAQRQRAARSLPGRPPSQRGSRGVR